MSKELLSLNNDGTEEAIIKILQIEPGEIDADYFPIQLQTRMYATGDPFDGVALSINDIDKILQVLLRFRVEYEGRNNAS